MGSIAFSDVILLKRNVKPEKLRKWCDFHRKMWRVLSETAEETEVRCSRHRQRDKARCEGLSTQLREECLQQLSYSQQQRLEAETVQERGTPTAGLTKSHEHQAIDPQTPLFHRAAVYKKIEKFHKGLGSLQVSRGSTCLEMKSKCGVCTLSLYRIDMYIYVGRYIKTIPLTYIVQTKVPAGRKEGEEQILYGRLHASSSLASYRRLEKAKTD